MTMSDTARRNGGSRRLRRALVGGTAMAMLAGIGALPALAQSAMPTSTLAQADAAAVAFSIPAQGLVPALVQFREQSGIQVAYESAAVADMRTEGVTGTMTPADALTRLLAGSGLAFEFTAERTVTLLRPSEQSGVVRLNTVLVERDQPAVAAAQIDNLPEPYAGGQVARGAGLGLLGNRDMMDTPLSTSSYTAKTVADSNAITVADVLERDPSVRTSATKGGILDAFFIRGFPIGEGNLGEIAFNGSFGVAPNYRVFADYAERIEVVKGPSALLNGMAPNSSVGGTINIVPKRAPDEDLTEVTLDYAQDMQAGTHVDVARRGGDDKAWGMRINGSYRNGDTALDNQSREAFVGALAADYRGEKLRATVDLINQVENLDAPVRPYLVAAGVDVPDAPNGARNVSDDWSWSEISDRSAQGRIEYDLSEQVMLFAGAGVARTDVDRLSGQVPFIQNSAGDTQATPFYYRFQVDRVTYDAGLRAELATGPVGHAISFQTSLYEDELSRGSASSSQALISNIYNPIANSEVFITKPSDVPKVSDSTLTGFALADTLSTFGDRVQLTLGGRYQTIEANNFGATGAVTSSYDDDALTPMVGLVVKPWSNVSLYANYIEGLSRGDIAPSTASNSGEALAPYVAKQYETGVKVDFGRMAAMVSVFQIEKPFGQLENGVFTDGGEQRNRGLEVSLFGEVTDDIRVFGGVTFLDAELTKTNAAATEGNRPIGVPEMQANLSAEWDTPFLAGLTLAGSVIYTGDEYVDTANTQDIPSWTRLDLGGRYETLVEGTPVTFRAAVENVFDESYWSGVAGSYGGLGLGSPRTVTLSVTARF